MNPTLLALLACPLCHGGLTYHNNELICETDKIAYPVRENIPIMLPEEARPL